jgi:hypothetical protein
MKGTLIMKKALLVSILLSIVFLPTFVRPETDKKEKAHLEAREKLAAMAGDFRQSKERLDAVTANLVKIGEEIGTQDANKIWSTVERILYAGLLCRTTSEMLQVATEVNEKGLTDYFEILKPHLLQGKGQLNMQNSGLQGYIKFVEDKTALWELDKAKEVMQSSLKLYDQALEALPPTNQ